MTDPVHPTPEPGDGEAARQEMPRYEAPQYEAPRYEAPQYEAPQHEGGQEAPRWGAGTGWYDETPPGESAGDRRDGAQDARHGDTAAYDTAPLFGAPAEPLSAGPHVPVQGGPPRARRRMRWVVVPLAAALVGGGVGGYVGAQVSDGNGNTVVVGSGSSAQTVPTASGGTTSTAAIAAAILPSVVSINVRGQNEADTGSGVVISSAGYILTNNHVVAAATGGGSVSVTFNDGSSAAARIVGTDQPSDLAVIKVGRTGLRAAQLGNSADVHVGDPVLAVGSPLGLSGTVTSGIVSALDRPVNTTDQQGQQGDPFGGPGGSSSATLPTVIDAIQTDAAINPGNSGGALVDMSGRVIGINSAIATVGSTGGQTGNIGVGFAIPISQARSVATQLISSGHASHPYLGVSVSDGTTSSGDTSVVVAQVRQGGPAAAAGIKVGDRVIAVDGKRVSGSDSLIATLRQHQPGDTVQLTITRSGKQQTVSVKLGDAGTTTQG
ncbi:MAG: S1C family serine protease [Frankiaceae bacterium]